MKRIWLYSVLCLAASGAVLAQSTANPFVYGSVNDQLQACLGIAGRDASYCANVSDFNDRQMCAGLAASSQDPCRTMTDRNLQLTCYGMAFAPNFPSNCRDITDSELRDFCFSAASWGTQGNCSLVSDPSDHALCQALTYRDSSYCAAITNANDLRFCNAVSIHDSSYCGAVLPSPSAGGPYAVNEGGSVAVTASGGAPGASYSWDLDGDGIFETAGQSVTFSALDLDGPASRTISVQITASDGQTATAQTTVTVANVAPTATFNAPASANPGDTIPLSLSAPVDVAVDLPTLQYAFDCGSGLGPFSGSSAANCTAPNSNPLVVRGQVRDKDGGVSEYTTTISISASTVPPDPYSAPPHNDSTFVVDRAAGCSTDGDHSITFSIPVDRVVGTPDLLIKNGLMQSTAVLRLPAFDVDSAGGGGINPERDQVYFNGNLVQSAFLTGAKGSWALNTFTIQSRWVNFPPDPDPKDVGGKIPTSVVNTVKILIDTGNTKTFSCTSVDWAALSIRVAHPVLLVHGFNSNGDIWHERWTNADRKGQLDLLSLPAATTNVGGFSTILDNAQRIKAKIDGLRLRWGVDKLNIVAHSKGGLDSRAYIEDNNTVATLVQIASPNFGTPLATLTHIASFIISNIFAPAIQELTVENMTVYNLFHGHNPNTRYVSLAGEYRYSGFFAFVLNDFYTALFFGANDRVVPAWSVRGLGYAQHLTYKSSGSNHQARHGDQAGSMDIYNQLVPYLKTLGGSSSLSASGISLLAKPATTKSVSEPDEVKAAVTTTKTIAETIAPGQNKTQTLYVDGTQPIGLMLLHGAGELSLSLTSPSGAHFDPASAATDPNVHFESSMEGDDLQVQTYVIETPEVGTWTLEVSAPATADPSGQQAYALTGVLTDSPILLEAATDRPAYHQGDPIIIRASLTNGGAPITAASVIAQVRHGDQSPASLTLADDGTGGDLKAGDGIYSGRFVATIPPGPYDVLVSATGPAATPFNREKLLLATVSASASRLNGTFSDRDNDTDSDGLFDDLEVQVGMDVTAPRPYRMLGELADANGVLIATASALTNLDAGTGMISLHFDGASIYKHGVDGPYLLRVVRVAEDDGSAILPLDERLNAYTTASYDHRQFQHPALAGLDQSVTTDEDTPVDITLGADSATPATLSFSIVNAPSHGALSGTAPHLTYTPEANFNGADVLTFQVSNGTIDSELATVSITVNPVNDPPAVAPIADSMMDEGTTSTVAVSASDVDGDDLKLTLTGLPAFATLTDKGDGTGTIVFAPGFDAAGTYHGAVTASDGTTTATATFTLIVNNVNRPPVANAGGPYVGNEGDRITLDASRSADPDVDGSIPRYEWDLNNDGVYGDATGATISTVFGDQGTYVVGLRVTDDQGAQATTTAQVIVRNVAPTVGAITAPTSPSPVGTAIAVSAPFADPGLSDTHTAVWDWNDGTTSAGTVLENGTTKSVSGTHVYTAAGVYTVKLTVTDKDGAAGSALYQYVVIYDPNGNDVTGGGWLTSPAGAYPADPALTGRVNFGFVAKYVTGASVPSGETLIQFQAGNLTFHSKSYKWLVVTGAHAQYEGTGEINGKGGYSFLLTAIDGQISGGGGSDKLRLKIWDTVSGQVVYDNQIGAADDENPTTSIQGGAIVIHSR